MKSFSVLKWISNIIGKNKIWIILLTLVQSVQGVLGVVFALSLREVIDSAVAKNTETMTKDIVILCVVACCTTRSPASKRSSNHCKNRKEHRPSATANVF